MKSKKIFDIQIENLTQSEFQKKVEEFLKGGEKIKISKINTEFLLRARENQEFKKSLSDANFNIADGKGVLWAARYLSLPLRAKEFQISNFKFIIMAEAMWQMIYSGASLVFYPKYCSKPICENIPGVEALYGMLEAADNTKSFVYIFGAEKDILEDAVKNLMLRYPKLKIAGWHDGFSYDEENILEKINHSKAELLVVALGSPKQEYWIRDNIDKLKYIKVAVGEGGSLDFVAGGSKRAPSSMQKIGLEWLWRLFFNKSKSHTGSRPKRVWRAVPLFIFTVVKWKLRNG